MCRSFFVCPFFITGEVRPGNSTPGLPDRIRPAVSCTAPSQPLQWEKEVFYMNNEKMGQFIASQRKTVQMTQKELADKLHITDKAVSKWERGLSSPDIALLSPLAGILGVTTGDLLNGERNPAPSEAVEESIGNALQYADKTAQRRTRSLQNICAAAFPCCFWLESSYAPSATSLFPAPLPGRFFQSFRVSFAGWSFFRLSSSARRASAAR